MKKDNFLLIGKIVGTHGIMGTLKVYSYAESISAFENESSLLIINTEGVENTFEIESVKPHKRILLLSLAGVNNRKHALALTGAKIFIDKSKLPEIDGNSYYWFDLIGLSVFTLKDKLLGKVDSIITTGSNDVYVVKDSDNSEILIPALKSVILNINLEHQKMLVDLPEGLY